MNTKGRKNTIFKIFLIPLIAIMLVQSGITIGTLILRHTTEMLEEYSSAMMRRMVENRGVILRNDMEQRWSAISDRESEVNEALAQFLDEKNIDLATLTSSGEWKTQFLNQLFPLCLNMLHSNSTTGIFMVLTDETATESFDGFFLRDSDPATHMANNSDLLLERGNKQLSRTWNIPLDTNWTSRFRMDDADEYFFEPWRAGSAHPDADVIDLGYWAQPFTLEKNGADPYEMISYSIPLRYEGKVYGVLGVEISRRNLYDYFPVEELNDTKQSGYMLALCTDDGNYTPLAGKGLLYDLVHSSGDFSLKETDYERLSLVEGVQLNNQGIYSVVYPLQLYGKNVPYDDTQWVLIGLDTEEDLFGMSRQLYGWVVAAVLIGLVFGVIGIYFVVRHLTRPIQYLMQCISRGQEGLREFHSSNILEIDALYDVVNELTEQQKMAENILLEEKERYKMALESSNDIFFSYDLQNQVLDIFNHKTLNGQWNNPQKEAGLINPEYIYESDREMLSQLMQQNSDQPHAEFRMRWPEETTFTWVSLSGKAIYDTDGRRWKLVGSIHDIQEQKEWEAEQLRRNTTDGVTGLYTFSAGIKRMEELRQSQPDGVMLDLFLDHLKDATRKNGIVFSDMMLEEMAALIKRLCQMSEADAACRVTGLRLNADELVLWLSGYSRERAEAFAESLIHMAAQAFPEERFNVHLHVGLSCAVPARGVKVLIREAKLARINSYGERFGVYQSLSKAQTASLPALREQEINSLGYSEDVSLVSVALNIFDKGTDFPAQMTLMIRKIARYYQAEGVLVSLLHDDFRSNYLNYQWHENGRQITDGVRKYQEEEKAAFFRWLGQKEIRCFSARDSRQELLQCFLYVEPDQQGITLPLYDSGSYIGNVCILGLSSQLLETPEEYQNLAELGRVIQSHINQQQHDIASKAKSEFLSRMSHEIRTPMNGIIGMTAIALQESQNPERILDCLRKIQSSSTYLLGLINDILDMSKIESGKMKLEAFHFNVEDLLSTVDELIEPQAAAKRIQFRQQIRLDHFWFFADRMRISQVLINLLGNAVKFTPEDGQIVFTVEERHSTETEATVYFAVQDTGIGIPKEEQERVFRSFEQASGTNPSKLQGTGLGLSISNRLVQMMGSSIHLESAVGQGSTFSFTIQLPLGEPTGNENGEHILSFDGYRVLVVEDNELNAEIAQCLLEERNFEVDCVHDGSQAVERIRTTPPGTYDLILMDIMMPVMNGLDATRAIRAMEREDCRTIPIIAMSANAFDDDLKKSVECGMNGHLSKPVEVDKLYRALDEAIRKR